MAYTFKGGIRLREYKLTLKSAIRDVTTPPQVRIPLRSGLVTTVSPGDTVKIGDVIAVPVEETSDCPIHAGVSGTVSSVEELRRDRESSQKIIVINSDGLDQVSENVSPYTASITDLSREEITDVIRRAGITGMDESNRPTFKVIADAAGKCEYLIVNCVESEPFITSSHRLLLEETDRVIGGIKILMRAVGVPVAYIAVESNKEDALRRMIKKTRKLDYMTVKAMKARYPQGDERQLIYAITGRELATGKHPVDAECVVFSAETCAAVYDAFATGMPLVRRIVTVSGDCVSHPANLRAPIGTPASYLVEQCGGLSKSPEKVIFGGPMMGQTKKDPPTPIGKGTSAVLLLSEDFTVKPVDSAVCIRCGRCVHNCPMHLMPYLISGFVQRGDMESAIKHGAMSCVECGTCSYNCPGKVEVVEHIKAAKHHICQAATEEHK